MNKIQAITPPLKQKKIFVLILLLAFLKGAPAGAETLQQAWDIALSENYTVKAAQEMVAAAKEQLTAAKATRLPGLSFKSGYTARDNEPTLEASLLGNSFEIPVENQTGYGYQLKASLPLYTSGRISSGIKATSALVGASEVDRKTVLLNLKMQVAEAYVTVLRAQRGLEVSKNQVASLESHEKNVLSLYNRGIVAWNDYLASQVSLADARQQMIQIQNNLDLAQAAYNRLLLRPLHQETDLEELSITTMSEPLDALTNKALVGRSELAVLRKNIQALQEKEKTVRAVNMPQLAIVGGYGYQENEYVVDEGQWSITLGLEWNVFDGGSSNHKANAIARQAGSLQQQYNEVSSLITLQTRQAWLDNQETEKRILVTGKTIDQAQENLKVSRNRYSSGLATNTEVLGAVTLLSKSEFNHANARYDRLLAILRLKRATGEL